MRVNKFARGQIWWIEDSINYDGNIQGKSRLCVIVSNDLNNSNSTILTVIPLTTQIKRLDIPTHITFYVNNVQNMTLCEHIKTVNMSKLYDYQGICDEELMLKIDDTIKIALGLVDIPKKSIDEIVIEENNSKKNTVGRKPLIPLDMQAQFIEDISKLTNTELQNKYNLTLEQLYAQKKRANKLLSQAKENIQ